MSRYFGMQKFDWYFSGTAGHNTLMFDGKGQDACTDPPAQLPMFVDTTSPVNPDMIECRARLVAFNDSEHQPYSIVDMSSSYGTRGVYLLKRGFALNGGTGINTTVVIRDEVEATNPAISMTWNMHTPANVTLNASEPRQALLTLNDKATNKSASVRVFARTEGCPTAMFTTVAANDFKPSGRSVVGITNLVLTSETICTLVEVQISPEHVGVNSSTTLTMPLKVWHDMGPFI